MKKTLLSVMAGLTVVGSASAAPTPEERKELCQLLIDKGTHVWVEKTQACIPADPCSSEDENIRLAYCTYKAPFYFVFANKKLSTPTEVRNNQIRRNDNCSKDFLSNPYDDDDLNRELRAAALLKYGNINMYHDMEYFMTDEGLLAGNYNAKGLDTNSWDTLPSYIKTPSINTKSLKMDLYAPGASLIFSYTYTSIYYIKPDEALAVFDTIINKISQTRCDNFYLHLIDSDQKIVKSTLVGAGH